MTDTEAQTPARTGQSGKGSTDDDRALTPFWMLRNEVDDLFDDFFRTGWSGWPMHRRRARGAAPRGLDVAPSLGIPSLDVIDKENEVKLVADLPGLSEDDIDVQVTDSMLIISGEKKEVLEEGDEDGERYVSERRFGSFRAAHRLARRHRSGQDRRHVPQRRAHGAPAQDAGGAAPSPQDQGEGGNLRRPDGPVCPWARRVRSRPRRSQQAYPHNGSPPVRARRARTPPAPPASRGAAPLSWVGW